MVKHQVGTTLDCNIISQFNLLTPHLIQILEQILGPLVGLICVH